MLLEEFNCRSRAIVLMREGVAVVAVAIDDKMRVQRLRAATAYQCAVLRQQLTGLLRRRLLIGKPWVEAFDFYGLLAAYAQALFLH